jgi:hypothetical protein
VGAVYGAKFNFVSGGPGYEGDVLVIHGDSLSGRPFVLSREGGKFTVVEEELR